MRANADAETGPPEAVPPPPGPSAAGEPSDYYRFVRREILPLLPASATCILDVGAGVGATAAWLRARYGNCRTVALEGNPAAAAELRRNVDDFYIVDLNGPLPDVGTPDLVLLLDVLEHLADPWDVLGRVAATMAPHGTVIVSVPNVAHVSVSVPLLLRGRFQYRSAGIMDRTHLRFFVRESAVGLLNSAGLNVEAGLRNGFDGPRTRLLDGLTLGCLREQLTKQYILAGKRLDPGMPQGPIRWLSPHPGR